MTKSVPAAAGAAGRFSRIADTTKMERTLARLALEIVERNKGIDGLVLVGIRSRGVPLARRLAKAIEAAEGSAPPVGAVDITLYRDDLSSIAEAPQVRSCDIPFPVEGKTVVLVDDVLFSGRTIRAALDTLLDYGRPKAIRLAVLVDRGHRELPIQADFVGRSVPTKFQERVDVRVVEIDGVDEIVIGEAPPPATKKGGAEAAAAPAKPPKGRKPERRTAAKTSRRKGATR